MWLASRAIDYSMRSLIKPYLKGVQLNPKGLATLRHLASLTMTRLKSPIGEVQITQHQIQNAKFEEIVPLKGPVVGALLYCPGGGYVCCSPVTHRNLTIRLALRSGLKVWVLNYSKIPEGRLRDAQNEALCVYQALIKQSSLEEGGLPVFLGGDSAGGHLAISTLLTARDRGWPLAQALVCLSPWTDLSCPNEGRFNLDWDPLIPIDTLRAVASLCLEGASGYDARFSPVYGDLSKLPPILVQSVETEVLFHDSTRFVARAQEAGVDAHLSAWTDVPHCFQLLAPYMPQAVAALDEIEYFINSQIQSR